MAISLKVTCPVCGREEVGVRFDRFGAGKVAWHNEQRVTRDHREKVRVISRTYISKDRCEGSDAPYER